MTTSLVRPLAREILIDGQAYKVVLTTEGVRLTLRGHRKGFDVAWTTLVALNQRDATPLPSATSVADARRAIVADISGDVHDAHAAFGRVTTALSRMGAIPPELLADFDADATYGRPERRTDWLVEPLLTLAEVASILRLSQSAVRRLPLRSITLGAKRRYRQSEVRRFLANQPSEAPSRMLR